MEKQLQVWALFHVFKSSLALNGGILTGVSLLCLRVLRVLEKMKIRMNGLNECCSYKTYLHTNLR